MKEIKGFTGEYRFLSNFWPCRVIYGSIEYNSSEAAYMAAKTNDLEEKLKISAMSPSDAKRYGKTLRLREGWDDIKYDVMMSIVYCKFTQNKDLWDKLLATGDAYLEETNYWGDKYWGVCDDEGHNHLGFILMDIRSNLREVTGNIEY